MTCEELQDFAARLSRDPVAETACETANTSLELIVGGLLAAGVLLAIGALAAPLWRWWMHNG